MIDTNSVALSRLAEEFHLQPVHLSTDYDTIRITVEDVSRPGLQLAGYFDHFEPARLYIIGNAEYSFLERQTSEARSMIFDRLFAYKLPALLFARSLQPSRECIEMAKKHNVSVLSASESTSSIVSNLITYLTAQLAPCITRHGVLLEVYGEGILLMGDSGIGKSETALELVKRGHRLIADDAVEIRKVSNNTLQGSAPELIRNYIELRGIGIINVAKLFGMGAVRTHKAVDMVVNIVPWNTQEAYDRLGLEDQFTDILGVQLPTYTIPVTPGRNLAVILEVAAINNRQRKLGYNAAAEFTEQINRHFENNMGKPL